MAKKKEIQVSPDDVTLEQIDRYEIIDSYEEDDFAEFADLKLYDNEQTKTVLSNIRNMVSQNVDRRKLKQALGAIAFIEKATEKISTDEFWDNLEIRNAYDAKCLVEAKRTEMQNLENLMRLDTVDEHGTAGFSEVGVHTVDKSGNQVSVFVKSK